jgi:hypothetical protein
MLYERPRLFYMHYWATGMEPVSPGGSGRLSQQRTELSLTGPAADRRTAATNDRRDTRPSGGRYALARRAGRTSQVRETLISSTSSSRPATSGHARRPKAIMRRRRQPRLAARPSGGDGRHGHATTSRSRGERVLRRGRGTDQRRQALAGDAGAGDDRRRQPHLEGRGARRWHREEPTEKVTGCKAWPIVWPHPAAGCTSTLRAPEGPAWPRSCRWRPRNPRFDQIARRRSPR